MATRPTHKLVLWNPATRDSSEVGVGWLGENGRISLKIGPGFSLSYQQQLGGLRLAMFPCDYKPKHLRAAAEESPGPEDAPDDEIPY